MEPEISHRTLRHCLYTVEKLRSYATTWIPPVPRMIVNPIEAPVSVALVSGATGALQNLQASDITKQSSALAISRSVTSITSPAWVSSITPYFTYPSLRRQGTSIEAHHGQLPRLHFRYRAGQGQLLLLLQDRCMPPR